MKSSLGESANLDLFICLVLFLQYILYILYFIKINFIEFKYMTTVLVIEQFFLTLCTL